MATLNPNAVPWVPATQQIPTTAKLSRGSRDLRPRLTVVFGGHVDAGKSTVRDHLLHELRTQMEPQDCIVLAVAYLGDVTGCWPYAAGSGTFETPHRRITMVDTPGMKPFAPSVAAAAVQADLCVLVVSARRGEFECGFEKGGLTREHTLAVQACGVNQMICVVNKMDECGWSHDRYNEIQSKMTPFLRHSGYDVSENLRWMPMSALSGANLFKPIPSAVCDWYAGPTFLDALNTTPPPALRSETDVLCLPIRESATKEGVRHCFGTIEAGSVALSDVVQILPAKKQFVVESIHCEDVEVEKAYPGDNVHLRLKGVEVSDSIHPGDVITSVPTTLKAVDYFQARLLTMESQYNIITAGSRFVMHIHAAQVEVTFHKLLAKLDPKTQAPMERNPSHIKARECVLARLEVVARPLVVEARADSQRMGRFTLWENGRVVAVGMVTKLYETTRDTTEE